MDRIIHDVPSWGYTRRAITSTATVVAADRGVTFDATSGTFDLALTAAATLGSGFVFGAYNSGAGVMTINPDGAETIRSPAGSAATLALSQGQGVLVLCNATGFEVIASTGIAPSSGSVISGLTDDRIVVALGTNNIETPATITSDQNVRLTPLTASRLLRTDANKQLESNAALTSGRVTIADVNGWPTDSANFTFSTTVCTIANTTSASSPTTGAFVVGNGTAATSVAIGAGNVNLGGNLTSAGPANRITIGSVSSSGTSLQITKTITSTATADFGINNVTTLNNATSKSSGNTGINGNVATSSGSSSTTGQTAGVVGSVDANSTTATHALFIGVQGAVRLGAGNTITTAHAIDGTLTTSAAGVIGTARGFYLSIANAGGAAITNAHGIYLENVNIATNNYAIFTNSGLVSIGDTTDATSSSTGAAQFSGGVRVAKNIFLQQNLIAPSTSVTTAAGTTTLTISSTRWQIFTGATTQNCDLPAANVAGAGFGPEYIIKNESSGNVTVRRAGADTIFTTASATSVVLTTGQTLHLTSNGSSKWSGFVV